MNDYNLQIVTICGGLGSQMVKYAFFLELQRINMQSTYKVMIDTSPYIKHRAWNGYELNSVFGIEEDDVRNELSPEEIRRIRDGICEPWQIALCHFSEKNAMMTHLLKGKRKTFADTRGIVYVGNKHNHEMFKKLKWIYDYSIVNKIKPGDVYKENDLQVQGITYFDEFNHTSDKYLLNDKTKLKECFNFPEFESDEDKNIVKEMLNCESVAIHIRRSDHMYDQRELFRRHYFRKAIEYIRKNVSSQLGIFVFSEDINWCRTHTSELGISENDRVCFVDWHKDNESYRDMQLMTYCKHNILAKSTFAFWGYYLSKWDIKDKIIVAPKKYWTEVKVHL